MTVSTETFPASVMATNDPEERGRIRVSCTGILGDEDAELPMWVEPLHDWGWFYVPEVDEIVEVEVVSGTNLDEVAGQSSLNNLDIKWRSKRFYGNSEGDKPTEIHPFFKGNNYGKRRGFATPFGHVWMIDDTSGAPKMTITWASERQATADAKISQIIFDTDGTVKLVVKGQHIIHIKEGEIEMQLSGGAALKVVGSGGGAVTTLGDGAVAAAVAEHLETLYNSVKSVFDSHIHITTATVGSGPTPGVISPSATPFPAWSAAIKSTKLKFPDG